MSEPASQKTMRVDTANQAVIHGAGRCATVDMAAGRCATVERGLVSKMERVGGKEGDSLNFFSPFAMTLEIDFSNLPDSVESSPHSQQRESAETTPNRNKRPSHRASLSPAPALLPIRVPFSSSRDSSLPPSASPPPRAFKPPKPTMLATKFKSGPSRTIYDLSLSKHVPAEVENHQEEEEIEEWGIMPPPSLFATVAARASTTESGRTAVKEVVAGISVTKSHSREMQPEYDSHDFDPYAAGQEHDDDQDHRYDQRPRYSAEYEPRGEQIQEEFDAVQNPMQEDGDAEGGKGEKRVRDEEELAQDEEAVAQRKREKKKRKKNRRSAVVSPKSPLCRDESSDVRYTQPQVAQPTDDQNEAHLDEAENSWSKNPDTHINDQHHSSPVAAPAYSHRAPRDPLTSIPDLFPGDLPFLKHADALVQQQNDSSLTGRSRWESCTEVEWRKGGDELVERFTKLTSRVGELRRCVLLSTLFSTLFSSVRGR